MGILKVSEVKKIIKENSKQATKDFVLRLDDAVRRVITNICQNAPKKRLKAEDVQI